MPLPSSPVNVVVTGGAGFIGSNFVRYWLGAHPEAANVEPLLKLRHVVPGDDDHLLHVVRMALRDQLRPQTTWEKLRVEELPERDQQALAYVCPGVHTAEAARFLFAYL